MIIAVLSCMKNTDTFEGFHHCMEKYWPGHPRVVYFTDGGENPYYDTIVIQHKLEEWTRGLRDFLRIINDEKILLMIDDCFIRRPVDRERIRYAEEHLTGNIALMNFEKAWDDSDKMAAGLDGWKVRQHGSPYEVSLMCGIWQKDKLLKVLERNCDPWTIELEQQPCGFDYYINAGDYIIDWGYRTFQKSGIVKGKWTHECVDFLRSEGIEINPIERGFCD